MILECPNCETCYEIPMELPPEGRKVRCVSCEHVWTATSAILPDFDEDEVIYRDSEPEDDISDAAMEAAFSSAVEETKHAPDEPASSEAESGERESPPIVIGKARKRRRPMAAKVAAGWAGLAMILAGVASVAYFQRVNVVRVLPGAAAAYARIGLPVNVRGIEFEKVKYSWETSAGRPVLEVYGDIVNVTSKPLRVPTVVFGLRTKEKVEVYQWAADVRSDLLPAGERTAFSAQIPTPPKSIRDVQVRFVKVR